MLLKTRTIESSFQHMRSFCIILICAYTVLAGVVIWQSFRMVNRSRDRVYILSSGKALEAIAGDRRENVAVEARDHIRTFHQYFFTLDPDEKVITTNITHALYLADASAKKLYDDLKENGYYAGIISGNISQQISVDSILFNMSADPWYFRCFATQKIIRPTSIVIRDLVTEGWLRPISRSDNNPHGFLIERWGTVENKDIRVEKR
jgi:conjugative transposon TraK protein